MKWQKTSQAQQDKFVVDLIGSNGTYIEIGGHLPKKRSNTYNLEVLHNYKGFSIEFDTTYRVEWEKCKERNNPIVWGDAIEFNYAAMLNNLNLNTHINYLSVDIEPPANTFKALKKVIESDITFDIITFEHDMYQCNEDYHIKACDYLLPLGYKVAVTDVWHKTPTRIFETWFVGPNISFSEKTFSQWLTRY